MCVYVNVVYAKVHLVKTLEIISTLKNSYIMLLCIELWGKQGKYNARIMSHFWNHVHSRRVRTYERFSDDMRDFEGVNIQYAFLHKGWSQSPMLHRALCPLTHHHHNWHGILSQDDESQNRGDLSCGADTANTISTHIQRNTKSLGKQWFTACSLIQSSRMP